MDNEKLTRWCNTLPELERIGLKGIIVWLKGAWILKDEVDNDEFESIIHKMEDDLIRKGIIPRNVEYKDCMTNYLNEGEEDVIEIKHFLWGVLYEDRMEIEYDEKIRSANRIKKTGY